MLEARDVTVRYPETERAAVEGVSLRVEPGHLVAVVGPNGSGKTTLLRALQGAVPLAAGAALLDGRPITSWPDRERARWLGVVAQREEYPFVWRADEIVMFGRYPWLGSLTPPGPHDREVVATAMARCDVAGFASRRIDTLSGGEWQRVRVARALAQEPRLLILDEPTTALDLGHEMELFELIATLVRDGLGAVVVTHHLNLAARFADRMLLLDQGREAARGTPREVLRADRIGQVFGWPVAITETPEGAPQVTPLRRPG
ncbi:MAG: ABC transporter ATP-binding protein [Gemmatimonadales bacterium]